MKHRNYPISISLAWPTVILSLYNPNFKFLHFKFRFCCRNLTSWKQNVRFSRRRGQQNSRMAELRVVNSFTYSVVFLLGNYPYSPFGERSFLLLSGNKGVKYITIEIKDCSFNTLQKLKLKICRTFF